LHFVHEKKKREMLFAIAIEFGCADKGEYTVYIPDIETMPLILSSTPASER